MNGHNPVSLKSHRSIGHYLPDLKKVGNPTQLGWFFYFKLYTLRLSKHFWIYHEPTQHYPVRWIKRDHVKYTRSTRTNLTVNTNVLDVEILKLKKTVNTTKSKVGIHLVYNGNGENYKNQIKPYSFNGIKYFENFRYYLTCQTLRQAYFSSEGKSINIREIYMYLYTNKTFSFFSP